MGSDHANILMHHGGAFSNDGTYDGGEIFVQRNIDTNMISYNYVIEMAESFGFRDGDTLFYAIPGQRLESGGRHQLTDYISVFEMIKCSNQTNYLEIYIEHNEQQNSTAQMAPTASVMDKSLLEAATSGDAAVLKELARRDPSVLLGTTPQGNTCLHISSIFGHLDFCTDVVGLNRSLLSLHNEEGETPLLTAILSGHVTLADSLFIECYRNPRLDDAILRQDKYECNVLHHSILGGHKALALHLIREAPALSQHLNRYHESPMFLAVMRGYEDIVEKLLEISDSKDDGNHGNNALHAAVLSGNPAIAKRIIERRPEMAKKKNSSDGSPLFLAVNLNKIDVLRVLLNYDKSLGYEIASTGAVPLAQAASQGHIGAAQVILSFCPDAPCRNQDSSTCLHHAVKNGHEGFVEFVLGSPQLRKVINMRDINGRTALHHAVVKGKPRMVRALLSHKDIDVQVLDNGGLPPSTFLNTVSQRENTISWNEVSMLMSKASPVAETNILNGVKEEINSRTREEIRSLTQTYTSNTSIVAVLIATITFAAAFTLPGGYSSDAGNQGHPVMGRKLAFKAFLIADTLAMCASLSVAFICIITRWEDLEFLIYYRSFTKKLMWFAYMATTIAFATGLYTVLAPQILWLAIAVCILTALLPIFTMLLGEWPILKLRLQFGKTFKSEILDMV